jgi:hypothetical protein
MGEGKVLVESDSWRDALLVGNIALLILLKVLTKLLLVGLNLFNQSGYMI